MTGSRNRGLSRRRSVQPYLGHLLIAESARVDRRPRGLGGSRTEAKSPHAERGAWRPIWRTCSAASGSRRLAAVAPGEDASRFRPGAARPRRGVSVPARGDADLRPVEGEDRADPARGRRRTWPRPTRRGRSGDVPEVGAQVPASAPYRALGEYLREVQAMDQLVVVVPVMIRNEAPRDDDYGGRRDLALRHALTETRLSMDCQLEQVRRGMNPRTYVLLACSGHALLYVQSLDEQERARERARAAGVPPPAAAGCPGRQDRSVPPRRPSRDGETTPSGGGSAWGRGRRGRTVGPAGSDARGARDSICRA